jgi:hypothetical protein
MRQQQHTMVSRSVQLARGYSGNPGQCEYSLCLVLQLLLLVYSMRQCSRDLWHFLQHNSKSSFEKLLMQNRREWKLDLTSQIW